MKDEKKSNFLLDLFIVYCILSSKVKKSQEVKE